MLIFDFFLKNKLFAKAEKVEKNKEIREAILRNRQNYAPDSSSPDEKMTGVKKTGQTQYNNNQGSNQQRPILVDNSEYWDYLESGKSWDSSKDGLLHFMMDCFYEIKKRKWLQEETDDTFSELLSQIKILLENMKQSLSKIEKEFNLDFSKFNLLINECIIQVPAFKASKAGRHYKITNEVIN